MGMGIMAFTAMHMGLSKSTIARRAALHHMVTDAVCAGLTPVAGVDEAVSLFFH